MYQIIVNGEVVALCDKLRFIKVNEKSGAYIQATEKDAQGVVGNIAYNLTGHDEIKTVRVVDQEKGTTETTTADVATVREVDGGLITFEQNAKIQSSQAKTNEINETALTGLMATTDLYEQLVNKGVL